MAAAHHWWPTAWDRVCAIRHDPYLTENLYDYQWQEAHNQRDEIDLVILWAWNSWMEQLYIEPDDGEGAAPAGDSLLRKTAWYTQRLRDGGAFQLFDPRQSELTASLPRTVDCDPPDTVVEPTPEPNIELGVALHLCHGYDLDADEMTGGLGADHWNSGIANGTGIHDNISVVPDLGFYASDGTGLRVPLGKSIGGLTSSHWNTDIGGRGRVTDEPEYGFYASDDPKAIAQQLQDMERAGINTIFVSWFGWGDDKLVVSISMPAFWAVQR